MSKKHLQKNLRLSTEFDSYAVRHPAVYDQIPYDSWIIFTDAADPIFSQESRLLIKKAPNVQRAVEIRKQGRVWTVSPMASAAS
jgi:hypothetical protein